jgi:hypothetical protein
MDASQDPPAGIQYYPLTKTGERFPLNDPQKQVRPALGSTKPLLRLLAGFVKALEGSIEAQLRYLTTRRSRYDPQQAPLRLY